MNKTFKIALVLITILSFSFSQTESEAISQWSTSLDISNRYIWRGTDYGHSPSIQPGIEFSIGSLTLGAWSAWQLSGDGNENDLYLTYSKGPLLVTLTDYFFPSNTGASDNFLDFNADSGAHYIEASVSGEFNGFSLYTGYFFHEPSAENKSIYANIAYGPFMVGLGNGIYTAIDEDNGDDKFSVVEVGVTASNDLYSCSWILNPNQETTFFVVGISF